MPNSEIISASISDCHDDQRRFIYHTTPLQEFAVDIIITLSHLIIGCSKIQNAW